MRPPIIGIHGKSRTGKDTVANFIISRYSGYRYGFADPLKAMLLVGFGIDFSDPYWVTRKEDVIPALGKSPRQLMQTLGTDWGRELIHPDVWLTLARERFINRGPGMVINDLRFENEAAWVRSVGGTVLHVLRGEAPKVNAHASEDGVARHDSDIVIVNNLGLDDLQETTHRLFDPRMGR